MNSKQFALLTGDPLEGLLPTATLDESRCNMKINMQQKTMTAAANQLPVSDRNQQHLTTVQSLNRVDRVISNK